MNECAGDHAETIAFVHGNDFIALTHKFSAVNGTAILLRDSGFVTAKHLAMPDFVVFEQLLFASGAFNGQHIAIIPGTSNMRPRT